MKRTLTLLLCLALLLALLPGCQSSGPSEPDPSGSLSQEDPALTARDLADAMLPHSGCADPDSVEYLSAEEEPDQLALYIENAYGLASWEEAAIIRATGASAFELAVLRLADEDAAVRAAAALMSYTSARQGDFTGYAPDQADMAANGGIRQTGPWLGLFICPDPDAADEAFQAALSGGASAAPPESPAPARDLSVSDIADAVWYGLVEATGRAQECYDVSNSDFYLTDILGLSADDCKQLAVLSGTEQIIVLRCMDEEAARRVEQSLTDRFLPSDFYAVCRRGEYVGVFSCYSDAGQARDIFPDVFLGVLDGKLSPQRLASVTANPAFQPSDLLLRLLIEGGICPDWRSIESKGWRRASDSNLREVAVLYGALPSQYEDCVYAFWDSENTEDYVNTADAPCHLALFQTGSEDAARALVPSLERGLSSRRDNLEQELTRPQAFISTGSGAEANSSDMAHAWSDRLTRQLDALDSAVVLQSGRYAAVLIAPDPSQASLAFPRFAVSPDTKDFFTSYYNSGQPSAPTDPDTDYPDRYRFTPPDTDDMTIYDTSAIQAAWESGDPSSLSDKDRAVYDAAGEILDEILTDGMTDLEKETAVYTWLTEHVDYDWRHQNILAQTPRESYEPYGGLVDRTAVCLGYAASFQLLMDLSGVECITVVGAAFHSEESHAWNMVRLDRKWYCVDVTWDANGREQLGSNYGGWRYFNITSDEMAVNHQWDYANVPEAVTPS